LRLLLCLPTIAGAATISCSQRQFHNQVAMGISGKRRILS
jgi:hypothetical protein